MLSRTLVDTPFIKKGFLLTLVEPQTSPSSVWAPFSLRLSEHSFSSFIDFQPTCADSNYSAEYSRELLYRCPESCFCAAPSSFVFCYSDPYHFDLSELQYLAHQFSKILGLCLNFLTLHCSLEISFCQ